MIPYVKVKFRVIVFQYRAKNDNLELGIFTSKHDSTCHKKLLVIVFMHGAKNDNSELGIHLRTNSEISEFSENSELSLWPIIMVQIVNIFYTIFVSIKNHTNSIFYGLFCVRRIH